MLHRIRMTIGAALLLCALSTACQTVPPAAASDRELAAQVGIEQNQGELTSRARWDSARIVVRWARDVRHAIQLCAAAGPRIKVALAGCSWGTSDACNVVVVQPRDFYDIRALAVLGHEVWHCLGATHD